ncbi:hypothetical protein MSG28_004304, partial [Choristoneura fumiferana]
TLDLAAAGLSVRAAGHSAATHVAHLFGRGSLSARSGFGSKNLRSLAWGASGRPAARCNRAATRATSRRTAAAGAPPPGRTKYFSIERRRVLPQRMVPHAAAEDEVERVVGSLQLRSHVQHVLVAGEWHQEIFLLSRCVVLTSSTLGTFLRPPQRSVFRRLARHTAAVPWHGRLRSAAAADRYSTRNGLETNQY